MFLTVPFSASLSIFVSIFGLLILWYIFARIKRAIKYFGKPKPKSFWQKAKEEYESGLNM